MWIILTSSKWSLQIKTLLTKRVKSPKLSPKTFFIGFSSVCFKAEAPLREKVAYHTFSIGIKEDLFLKLAHKLPVAVEKMH
jgi:hypothetical protein